MKRKICSSTAPASIRVITSGGWRESRSAARIRARQRTKRRPSTSALCCREMIMELAFYIAGAVAVISTILMLTRLNVVHALLYLIVSLLAVAVVFYVVSEEHTS